MYIPVSLGMMARDGAGGQWPRVVLFSMAGCGVCVGFLWLGGVGGTPSLSFGTLKFFALALLVCEFEVICRALCKNSKYQYQY